MKQLVLLSIFLVIYLHAFSQNTDSIPQKKFEAFFGCACCRDTVVLKVGPDWKYTCTLYKSAHLLIMNKNEKVIWKRDLKELFEEKNLDEFCVNGIGEKWDDYILVSQGSKTRLILSVKTGKKVKKLSGENTFKKYS